MMSPFTKKIADLYPTLDALLEVPDRQLEKILLQFFVEVTDDPIRRMATREGIVSELFSTGKHEINPEKQNSLQNAVNRAFKCLEDAALIEEPDPLNGKNGFRKLSHKGREAQTDFDFAAAKIRARFTRDLFHPLLPDAAWNAFLVGDYDTAVFESFKSLESSVRKKGGFTSGDFGVSLMEKAFDPANGPLTDNAALKSRRMARCNLFKGAFGEIRNPKAHGDPSITDPLAAVEEMITASMLRIVAP